MQSRIKRLRMTPGATHKGIIDTAQYPSGIWIFNHENQTVTLRGGYTLAAENLVLTDLPTSNPGGTGNVWNDSGTLKIT